MKIRSSNLPEMKYIAQKSDRHSLCNNEWMQKIKPIREKLKERNQAIEWMYRAFKISKFDKVTLVLCIALLDKLILEGFLLTDGNLELLTASLVLLATKFNQIYPITIKRLNSLLRKDKDHSVAEFREMELQILAKLNFDLSIEETVYYQINQLFSKLQTENVKVAQEIVKIAILSPVQSFRFGADVAVMAITSLTTNILDFRGCESKKIHQAQEVRKQLSKLRTDKENAPAKFLSPQRVIF